MNMFESLFSANSALNEQVARQIFDILPEGGPLVIILDRQGHFWPSCSEEFTKMNITKTYLKELTDKIDDGVEPVITQCNDCSIAASQLETPKNNLGYVILAFSQKNPESAMADIDILEIVLGQINLIAKLIEQNNQLYELSVKHYNAPPHSQAAAN